MIHEKYDLYKLQQRLSIQQFLLELPNFLFLLFCAIGSKSLIIWMDFIDSTNNVIHSLFIVSLSHKLKNNLKYEYNYGIGKVEAIASVFCDSIMITSISLFVFFSINELINPSAQNNVGLLIILFKIANVCVDMYYVFFQYSLYRKQHTNLSQSELASNIKDFLFDFVVLCSLLATYIFNGHPLTRYISPIVTLILSAFLIWSALQRFRSSLMELTDRTLDEEEQKLILKSIMPFYNDFENVTSIKSHRCGHTVYIDLLLTFPDNMTYLEIITITKKITENLQHTIKGSIVQIILRT